MTDWETRMSERAHARERERLADERSAELAREKAWHEANDTTVEAYVEQLAETFTPEELAVPKVAIPCACSGAPRELQHLKGEAPCNCALWGMARGLAETRV